MRYDEMRSVKMKLWTQILRFFMAVKLLRNFQEGFPSEKTIFWLHIIAQSAIFENTCIPQVVCLPNNLMITLANLILCIFNAQNQKSGLVYHAPVFRPGSKGSVKWFTKRDSANSFLF